MLHPGLARSEQVGAAGTRFQFRKTRTLLPCKADLFICFKGNKSLKKKKTSKFRGSTRIRFEDTKRIMLPEMHPKSFGTFESPRAERAPQEMPTQNNVKITGINKNFTFKRKNANLVFLFRTFSKPQDYCQWIAW